MALGIDDLAVGHWSDPVGLTGCTVVLPPPGNVSSVSVRGGAPGTRETDLLQPQAHVRSVSALLLTGGSAFGLAAAQGVVDWCERNGIGYTPRPGGRPIPIVPAAVVFDLGIGDWDARPGPAAGEAACAAASTRDGPSGSVGAGTGVTVGKLAGLEHCMRGGLGHALSSAGKLTVGALAVVNAVGDVLDEDGTVLAGTRVPGGAPAAMRASFAAGVVEEPLPAPVPPGGNTTVAVLATNATLSKAEAQRVAVQAHDGLARAVRPSHTSHDGDTVFTVAVPRLAAPPDLVAYLAEEALAAAIRAAVRAATPAAGVPAWPDLRR